MRPLSRKKRIVYFALFSIIFVFATVLLISYATGYRLTESLAVARTGGFYVSSTLSGSNISVAGKFVTKTSLFQRNSLIQNLKPGSYVILVSKDGFQSWKKELKVFAERITEAHPFTLKDNSQLQQVFPYYIEGDYASSTELVGTTTKQGTVSGQYTVIKNLFATSTSANGGFIGITATSTTKTLHKLSVIQDKNGLSVFWIGNKEDQPYYFCDNDICQNSVQIKTKLKVKNLDFFPGRDDVLLVSTDSGVYAIEVDNRSTQNIQNVALGKNLEFRVGGDGVVYIKKESNFYSVNL